MSGAIVATAEAAPTAYVGRIVGVGLTDDGRPAVAYRVSSRAFPNRQAVRVGAAVRIEPRPGSPDAAASNPYVAYECLLWDAAVVVASNGSHTRVLFDRLRHGGAVRDLAATVLLAMDREFDAVDTPRLAAIIDRRQGTLHLASVTAAALSVVRVDAEPGRLSFLSTTGQPLPDPQAADSIAGIADAEALCGHLLAGGRFAGFSHPVCTVAAVLSGGNLDVALRNPG